MNNGTIEQVDPLKKLVSCREQPGNAAAVDTLCGWPIGSTQE
jgi:hypothetical protein